jgi:predicted transcriptional regulator of viral defense system
MPADDPRRYEDARQIFRDHGGMMRTAEAIRAGVHPRTLYAMRDTGELERLGRGLYRLSDMQPLGNPDLVEVALKAPKAVVCLISALSYHDLTTQIPHEIHIAIARGMEPPRVKHPPTRVFTFSKAAFEEGVETQRIDNVPVRIYAPEKTLADCFKYRNKIGLDVAVEALKLYRERRHLKVDDIMQFARTCRIEKVIRPYLEATL